MGADAEFIVPELSQNLYHDRNEVRRAAAQALGEIGPPAKSTVPLLITMLLTDSPRAREDAAIALSSIMDPSAVPALAKALESDSLIVSVAAAESLQVITGESFRLDDEDGNDGGYLVDPESGLPWLVVNARRWWFETGRFQIWQDS